MGVGQAAEQRGFSRVGIAHQADIRDQFELKGDRAGFPRRSGRRFGRRLTGRGGKVAVSESAFPALGQAEPVPVFQYFAQTVSGFVIERNRAGWNRNNEVGAVAAMTLFGLSFPPVNGALVRAVVEIEQGIRMMACADEDGSAVAAIASSRSAMRHILLPPERGATVATVSRGDV